MKKYIIVALLLIAFSACGPVRRTVKTESTSRSRDSIRIEQVRSDLTNSVKTLSDNSRIRIVYSRSERDSVTGEQLIEREEIRENNVVSKDSIVRAENERIHVGMSFDSKENVKGELEEKWRRNWMQLSIMLLIVGILVIVVFLSLRKMMYK